MDSRYIMNKREEKVMEHLWTKGIPMTITELEELMVDEKLGKASIFKAVQSLMKYGYIKINGVELVGKSYARRFEAAISKEEYAAIVLLEKGFSRSSLGEIAVAMIGSEKGSKKNKKENEKLIADLERVIAKLKE